MSDPAIPLHQVLLDEHNLLHPEAPIAPEDLGTAEELAAASYAGVKPGDEAAAALRQAAGERLVRAFYRRLHESGVRRSALCLSGGGIRSATFGLGLLQGLARLGLLARFDYLSTVSGGGYVGSWLSAWIAREGAERVEEQLRSQPASPLSPEPEPLCHLRSYSRYMSPRLGLLSADTWTLVSTYGRNLFLNWLVLLPFLAAVLMIPRLSLLVARQRDLPGWLPPAVFWAGAVAGAVAIAYIVANRPSLRRRSAFPERWKGQGWFLALGLLPLGLMAVAETTWWAWGPSIPPWNDFVLFGIGLHLGGYLLSRLFVRTLDPVEIGGIVLSGAVGGGLAGWAALALFRQVPPGRPLEIYICVAAPLLLAFYLLSSALFVGLSSKCTEDADREWLARTGGWVMIAIVARSGLALLVIFGPLLWHRLGVGVMSAAGGLAGLATLALGRSAESGANTGRRGGPPPRPSRLAEAALPLVAPLFALSILVGLAFATTLLEKALTDLVLPNFAWPREAVLQDDPLAHLRVVADAPGAVVVGLTLGLLALSGVMGCFVDINRFSLHATYRDRLIRAYLGASRSPGTRRPDPFTGLDEGDNLPLTRLVKNPSTSSTSP
ncbi:MAG TPA: patatin-like phospholipase family protein [Thermoanaerobaculia bacterium]|nr:patatin-like phospholipase family protein [Thermoanaerobaculia bacterium]